MQSKREREAWCGDYTQLFGIRASTLADGKSKGTRAYHLRNGCGLEMLVLPDKCFTVAELFFNGVNVGFMSKTGICGPEFFQEEGTRGFLRNFEAGFLTLCGMTYMGTPGVEDGQPNGLHGVISNTPAESPFHRVRWEENVPWIEFGGQFREGYLFGPNLRLSRKFRVSTVENRFWIADTVENIGFERAPLMLLYHFNFGYPMLDESCRVHSNLDEITCRDPGMEDRIALCDRFSPPVEGFQEEVFFRTASQPHGGEGHVLLHNENRNMAVDIRFDLGQLPVLNQWKNPRAGDYALGLEPGTCHVGGRIRAQEENRLRYIEPGETKEFHLEITCAHCVTSKDLPI